jgi:hypothetical protein
MKKIRLQIVNTQNLNEEENFRFKAFNIISKEMKKRDNCILKNISFDYCDYETYSEIIRLTYLSFKPINYQNADFSTNIRIYRYFPKSMFLSFVSRAFFSDNFNFPLGIANLFIQKIEEELQENYTVTQNL